MKASERVTSREPHSLLEPRYSQLVIGYGNPLRADDGLGWQVAQQLTAEASSDDLMVIAAHQLTPELAEPISRARLVVFVDAREGDQPDRVESQLLDPIGDGSLAFSHDVNPPALLAMARALYGACPTAVIVSVDGNDFGYGIGLSPQVQAALPAVIQQVRAILTNSAATLIGAAGRELIHNAANVG
jgi:hydrogenase maturation protease